MSRQPKIRKCGKISFGFGFTYLDYSVKDRFKTDSGSYRSLEARRRKA
jgi:hypothetical protein